jgi:hypothetical protein
MPKLYKPDEIMNRLMSGEKILPKQGEDHNAVIMLITQYMSDAGQKAALEPEIATLLQQQVAMRQAQMVNEQIQQMMMQQAMEMQARMGPPQMPPGQGGAPMGPPQRGNGMTF